ncbi:hypothetical protein [Egicoccus sp. AB-alg2]|uniref:hypothetical protein n=1 Tax=Egicoccus sp. AB-alg2 TaxID=3242693 RepID=UPI00359DA952
MRDAVASVRRPTRDDLARLHGSAWWPAVSTVVLVGLIVGVFVLLRTGSGRTAESRAFAATVEFHIWALALAATVALWVVIAAVVGQAVRRVFPDRGRGWFVGAASCYGLLILALMGGLSLAGGGPVNPLHAARVKVLFLVGLIMALGFPAVAGLWCTQARLGQFARFLPLVPRVAVPASATGGDVASEPTPTAAAASAEVDRAHCASQLVGLRRLTQRILTAVSIGISAGVVSTGALRNALLSSGAATPETFPSYWVLAYGALFTGLFAIVFVPTFVEWRGVAARLVDEAFPIPPDGIPGDPWHEGRASMSKMLQLDVSPLRALGPLAGVLAPVATSLAAVFVSEVGG